MVKSHKLSLLSHYYDSLLQRDVYLSQCCIIHCCKYLTLSYNRILLLFILILQLFQPASFNIFFKVRRLQVHLVSSLPKPLTPLLLQDTMVLFVE